VKAQEPRRDLVLTGQKPDSHSLSEDRWRIVNKKRLAVAFAVAAISDALSFGLTFAPTVQWGIDLVTALLLFVLLGRKWALLPGLIAEAIPGLYIFPFWILVVGSIATWGAIRRPQSTGPPPGGGGPRLPQSDA
jgi:hypothetical protein